MVSRLFGWNGPRWSLQLFCSETTAVIKRNRTVTLFLNSTVTTGQSTLAGHPGLLQSSQKAVIHFSTNIAAQSPQ